jgi:hypothetical protein
VTRPPPLDEDGGLEGALGPLTEEVVGETEEPLDCGVDDDRWLWPE